LDLSEISVQFSCDNLPQYYAETMYIYVLL
jgi:hypothetical protein